MATGCTDEEDVPPLEDLSEIFEKTNMLGYPQEKKTLSGKGEVHQANGSDQENGSMLHIPQRDAGITVKQPSITDSGPHKSNGKFEKTYEKRKENGQSPTQTFGGFQKGFLNRKKPKGCQHGKSSEKTEPKSVLSVEEKLPTICSKDTNPDDLRIPEVQEAMKTPFLLENKDWITDDLLKKIKDRPDLLKKLADPRYSQALSHFQSNPQEGWKLVSNNKELQTFIKEFCGVLGEHFTAMADQKSDVDGTNGTSSSTSTVDEQKLREIMSDPETMNVLKDPWVSKLITNLKNNPPVARRMLATSRPEVLPKIKKLIDAEILTFQ